jgi:hypothetical protein
MDEAQRQGGGNLMGEVGVDGLQMPKVQSVEEMVGRFCGELNGRLGQWNERLAAAPEDLETIESEVHRAFARGADLVIAGLLAVVMKRKDFDDAAQKTHREYSQRLDRGRKRTVQLRLLGGLIIWVSSLYCAPRKSLFRSKQETAAGLHVELAQLGVGKGTSPGLQSRVARKVALLPSLALAQAELEREGVKLNFKSVRRIAYECGTSMLKLRKSQLDSWRAGTMPAGSELAGKRVSVQIDGGRMKIRGPLSPKTMPHMPLNEDGLPSQDAPGRSKPKARKTYAADWREPKVMTIFIHDEQGKMVRTSQATIDGTLLGPNAITELVAMHLHRLGAASALSVTFVSDGAPWIWDRVARIIELAKLSDVKTYQVLDNCHAAHHISLALHALGISTKERMPLFRSYRTLLRNGHWRQVVDELTDFGEMNLNENPALQTEIAYIQKHGEAGRLRYPYFTSIGVPLGSGSIESSIRRVINMRLKSNAMFWRTENGEAMLQVRASVISDRWDTQRLESKRHQRRNAVKDWTWIPQDMRTTNSEPSQSTAT